MTFRDWQILLGICLCIDLGAQDEGGEISRIRELMAAKNWAGVVQLSNRFAQNFPLSSLLSEVSYYTIVARVEGGDLSGALTEIRRFQRLYPHSSFQTPLAHWEGRIYLQMGNYSQAEEVLKRHLGMETSGALAAISWFYLAQAQEARQKFRDAEESYAQAVKLGKESPFVQEAMLGRSRVLRRAGQRERARSVLREFLSRPEAADDRLRLEYARVLLELGNTEEGIDTLKRLESSREPFGSQANFLRFSVLVKNQRWQEALEVSEKLSNSTRREPVFLLNLAEVQRQLGNLEAARAIWRQVLDTGTETHRQMASFNLALSYDNPSDAYDLLNQARRGPDVNIARDARWRMSFLGSKNQQMDVLREIVADDKDTSRHLQAYRRLLLLGQEVNDTKLVLESLNALIETEQPPDLFRYLFLRAKSRSDEEYDLALKDLQRLVQQARNTTWPAQANYEIGNIYARRDEYARAEGFFHLASQQATGELRELALLARGIALFNAQNYPLARQVFERLIGEHPESNHRFQANFLRARSLIKLGQENEARRHLMALVQLGAAYSAEAAYELGMLDSVQDPLKARTSFLESYRLSQDNKELRLNSLDAALSLSYRSGDVPAMIGYLTPAVWGNEPRSRARLEYWQTLVLAATDFESALRRAARLLATFPRIYLDMENAPFLSNPQRLQLLQNAAERLQNEEEQLQVSLRRIQLLRSMNDAVKLQQEILDWIARWGSQVNRFETARIVARFVENWDAVLPGLEPTQPAIRAEFLLYRSRLIYERDPEMARRYIQRVLTERTERNQKHEAQWLSGMILLLQGKTTEAKTLFQNLLRESPISENRANILLGLGIAEKNLGNADLALQHLQSASREGPWDSSAQSAFEAYAILKTLGKEAEANQYRSFLREKFPSSHWTRRLD